MASLRWDAERASAERSVRECGAGATSLAIGEGGAGTGPARWIGAEAVLRGDAIAL